MFQEIMKDAIRYGCFLGFRPFQLSVWITALGQIHQKSIEMIKNNGFDQFGWMEMAESVLANSQGNQEVERRPSCVFTNSELKVLISYLIRGYIQHMQLYRHVFRHAQDQDIRLKKVWIDEVAPIVESMKSAVKASEWDEYCRIQKEKSEADRISAQLLEAKRLAEEKALVEQEEREKHSMLLRQRVGKLR
jgi:hypothetical protein